MSWVGVAKVCAVLVTLTACVVGLRKLDDRPNPYRWQGGDGPNTECVYELLPDGRGGRGGGDAWVERWTVCDRGDKDSRVAP